jgi:hypothetical protein
MNDDLTNLFDEFKKQRLVFTPSDIVKLIEEIIANSTVLMQYSTSLIGELVKTRKVLDDLTEINKSHHEEIFSYRKEIETLYKELAANINNSAEEQQ